MTEKSKIKPYVVFADGTFAILDHTINITIKEGDLEEEAISFYLRPTERLRLKFDIKEKEDFINIGNFAGWWKKNYKRTYCTPLDFSPRSQVWLLSCDWNGKYLDYTKGLLTFYKDKNDSLRRENKILRLAILKLNYDFLKFSKDPMIYLRVHQQNIKRLVEDSNVIVNQPQAESQSNIQ